jgi:type I restriction enzyme R subunit
MAGEVSTIGALLDETGGSIKTGPFGTKLKASEYTSTGVPVISVGEVGFGRLRIHHDTLGYSLAHGPHIAPEEPSAERDAFGEVVLVERLREALRQLNPSIPEEAREEALRKVLRVATPSLAQTNRAFHRLLRDGVDVEYARPDGSTKHDKAWLVDFSDVRANDWLAVNQFTVREGDNNPSAAKALEGTPRGSGD